MFEPFQNMMTKAAGRYGISREVEAANICYQFKKIIPEVFKNRENPEQYIEPAYFKNNILVINVKTPAWAQEVIMRKTQIIEEINTKAGKEVLKNLRAQLK